jgi:hypothetical protein
MLAHTIAGALLQRGRLETTALSDETKNKLLSENAKALYAI